MDAPLLPGDRLKDYSFLYSLAQLAGILLVVLVAVYIAYFREGFSWKVIPQYEFNWHPLLMVLGMIYLYGNCMQVKMGKTFRNSKKLTLKIVHGVSHTVSFVMMVIALQAVFDSHNLAQPPIPNMYSLHSWVGMTAAVIFTSQLLIGFIIFLYPALKPSQRKGYLPFHVYFGIFAFILCGSAAITGLNEKAIFSVPKYSTSLSPEGLLMNFIGVMIVIFSSLVVFLVARPKYKRPSLPEDRSLLPSKVNSLRSTKVESEVHSAV